MHRIKLFLSLFFTITSGVLYGQASHELGVTFRGHRIWEIDATDFLIQDLDYSISPNLVYQLNLKDESFLLRAELGWIRRFSDSEIEIESTGATEFRNDISHLVGLNLGFGGSIFKSRVAKLQVLGGILVSQDYYSNLYFRSLRGTGGVIIEREESITRPLKLDFAGSISYQHQLAMSGSSISTANLSLIAAIDFIYLTERREIKEGYDNTHPSISSGFKIGLLYKVGSSRRGLF